jgi:transcription initiation factor IIF auxiliary subunit
MIKKKRKKTWNDRYYRVKVWINSPKEFINKIKYVKYIRHPSFKNQEYTTEDRTNNFQDKFSCWGEFLMRIEIHLVNEQLLKRTHYITFHN